MANNIPVPGIRNPGSAGDAVMRTLKKRVERLERASGTDLEIGLHAFAKRMAIPPEPLLTIAAQHREQLGNEVWPDGTLTWEALCYLHDSGAFG
jgi:hypothetical protein